MSIDEAINILKGDNDYNKSIGCDTSYEEQLAEWLEELKALKENSISKETFEKMKSRAYKKGHRQVYNKAIDDFTEKMVIMMPGHMQDIERIAQRLKAGGKNE